MKVYENYIITTKLNLNLVELKSSCYKMKNLIDENFKEKILDVDYVEDEGKLSPLTTQGFELYNLLMYGFSEFHSLYFEIQKTFRQINTNNDQYYIQSWLNMYKQGNFVDWHNHYPPRCNSWHGFFCVDCEPSKTTYRIPNVANPIDIISENNLLVISKSDGDSHRTWPWEFEDRDRITIAFDIVPLNFLSTHLNHWIPI